MSRRSPRGFTLMELVAALTLLGFVMLGGVLVLDQLSDSAARIARASRLAGREGNGSRMLYRLLADAQATSDTTKRFVGDAHSIELWTMCDMPSGWAELCRVSMAVDESGDSSAVLADLTTGESIALRRQHGPAEFLYYNPSLGKDSAWARQWSSSVTLPVAVGLEVEGDTIVLPVRARE